MSGGGVDLSVVEQECKGRYIGLIAVLCGKCKLKEVYSQFLCRLNVI